MGEKKRRLAAAPSAPPRFDERRIGLAFQTLAAGDRGTAETMLDALQATAPDAAPVLHALGVLALQLDRNAQGEALLVRAATLEPRDAALRCHLAIVLRRLGRPDRAMVEFETAIDIDPTMPEAHSNLGNLLLDRGDFERGRQCFERALALRRDDPDALNGLGNAELALGEPESACEHYMHALTLQPSFHEALYNLSRARMQCAAQVGSPGPEGGRDSTTNVDAALASILSALRHSSLNPAYWTQLEACLRHVDLGYPVDPPLREMLLRALDHPAVDPARLARPILGVVRAHPASLALARILPVETVATVEPAGLREALRAFLAEPLLAALLRDAVVPDAFVQRAIACARRLLLADRFNAPGAGPFLSLDSVVTMAHQGFHTEYVNGESLEETAWLDRLAHVIADAQEARAAVPLHDLALYACYRGLRTLGAAVRFTDALASTPLRSLGERQIGETLEEERLRSGIPALTPIVDPVSSIVRAQYESNPYPRWVRARREAPAPSVAAYLRGLFRHARLEGVADGPARILIAGCGSGRHPVQTAQRFPDSKLVALDLSLASLAYAARKTRELGLRNVTYAQADILALGSLGDRFDVIECTGVLHHLKDPVAGWRTLLSLLEPGGVMRVGLYSEIARRHVVRARELVQSEGFAPTPEGIRAFRTAALARAHDPLLARLTRGEDFYSLSGCRDLVFHPQEHRFTLPAIGALLAELGLEWLGFELPDAETAAGYRRRFPDDPRLANLANWHRYEQEHPDVFAQMYQFWVRSTNWTLPHGPPARPAG